MAANASHGRGQMRPHNAGRTPSFVVVGLMIVIAILGFNYWNVSSKNSMLAREVNDNRDRIRVAAVKKLAMEKRNDALMQKIRDTDSELEKQRTVGVKHLDEVENLKRQVDTKVEEVSYHKTEKEQMKGELDQCKQDKSDQQSIAAQAKREKEDCDIKLRATEEKCNQAAVPQQADCTKLIDSERVRILTTIYTALGVNAINTLQQAGVNTQGLIQGSQGEAQQQVQGQDRPVGGFGNHQTSGPNVNPAFNRITVGVPGGNALPTPVPYQGNQNQGNEIPNQQQQPNQWQQPQQQQQQHWQQPQQQQQQQQWQLQPTPKYNQPLPTSQYQAQQQQQQPQDQQQQQQQQQQQPQEQQHQQQQQGPAATMAPGFGAQQQQAAGAAPAGQEQPQALQGQGQGQQQVQGQEQGQGQQQQVQGQEQQQQQQVQEKPVDQQQQQQQVPGQEQGQGQQQQVQGQEQQQQQQQVQAPQLNPNPNPGGSSDQGVSNRTATATTNSSITGLLPPQGPANLTATTNLLAGRINSSTNLTNANVSELSHPLSLNRSTNALVSNNGTGSLSVGNQSQTAPLPPVKSDSPNTGAKRSMFGSIFNKVSRFVSGGAPEGGRRASGATDQSQASARGADTRNTSMPTGVTGGAQGAPIGKPITGVQNPKPAEMQGAAPGGGAAGVGGNNNVGDSPALPEGIKRNTQQGVEGQLGAGAYNGPRLSNQDKPLENNPPEQGALQGPPGQQSAQQQQQPREGVVAGRVDGDANQEQLEQQQQVREAQNDMAADRLSPVRGDSDTLRDRGLETGGPDEVIDHDRRGSVLDGDVNAHETNLPADDGQEERELERHERPRGNSLLQGLRSDTDLRFNQVDRRDEGRRLGDGDETVERMKQKEQIDTFRQEEALRANPPNV